MFKKKISHSAWEKYITCPKMYDLHYNKRLRPSGATSSALLFGLAMDEALNYMLLSGNLEKAVTVFRTYFKWEYCQDVAWDDRDFDISIISKEMMVESTKHDNPNAWLSWACMRVKGRMLLEAYFNEIYPLIEEVEHVQRKLHNRPGFIDFIAKLRGYGRVLVDNKTSASPYRPDAIANSTQLALYAKDHGISQVGFVVLNKQIQRNTKKICERCNHNGSNRQFKTCPKIINGQRCHGNWIETYNPKARIQLMVENVPEINKELIEESICETEKGIKAGVFPRNLKACGKIYGKPCPYINYCWKGDKTGLEVKPKEKK